MTTKPPVSTIRPIFFDAQQVDNTDLSAEQNYVDQTTVSIIGTQVGAGILPESLTDHVLFDSSLVSGYLDGKPISIQTQPSDTNFGNQLQITLSGSSASGRKSVKLCIIGLDFQSNLQYETFYFKANETQLTSKHFAQVQVLLFNDLVGDPSLSFNLGGNLLITEANPLTISKDTIMVSQDIQPNLFFRDFFVDPTTGFLSLGNLLQAAMPLYDINDLNILTQSLDNLPLLNGDVTTQLGQKFQATTNNIQKVSLLLSVRNQTTGQQNDLAWNGDIVVSIYPLQSSIDCPTDVAPNLPIDFSPTNIPLAQISFDYGSLQDTGVILDSVPQPVDFIFSNSPIAAGNVLVPGQYYAVTIKRSGAANKCDILVAVGGDVTANSRITTFTGSLWVDITDEDLWFKIWTDSAKVSDGQAFDNSGHGVTVPKTTIDPITQATIDYSYNNLGFVGNDIFRAVLSANTVESTVVTDQKTGNPVFSRQQYEPSINLLNTIDINSLEKTSQPLILGSIADRNIKFYNSYSSTINSKLYSATLINDELLIKIVDDPTDGYRFDTSVSGLVTNLLNGDLIGAKIVPDSTNPSTFYRVAEARLCSMILGDVDGNGIIDDKDLDLLNSYVGYNLNVGLAPHTVITTDGYTTTFSNGYKTLTQSFATGLTLQYQLVDPVTNTVVATGSDGVLVPDPSDTRLAAFSSATILFNTIIGLSGYKLVILSNSSNEANWGGFDITNLDPNSDVLTIRKVYLTGDVLSQMLRADIDGDFYVSTGDGYLLESYIERAVNPLIPASIYPGPTSNPYNKIGTRFNVVRLRLEKFADRSDDYASNPNTRATSVHPTQDIYSSDTYFASHNFYSSPVPISFNKELVWDDSLISTSSKPRLVPTIFSAQEGLVENSCTIDGVQCKVYPIPQDFDPGYVDVFAPNNIVIGAGELKRPSGDFYKVDFEVGTIVLEIPDGMFGSEKTIDIMNDFIIDYTGNGTTRLGFPSLKFADCSFVGQDALSNDQLRFSVAVQSFSPNTNGLSSDGYYGAIVDGKMGVSIDYTTGLLTLNFTNLYEDVVLSTLSTKVQVNVFLKRGGFNNAPLFVDSSKVQNMLSLVSVFSDPNDANLLGPGPQVGVFSSIQLVGGSQQWVLADSNGQQTEVANKYKIRTSSAIAVNAFVPVAINDNTLTALEVVVLAKNKAGADCAKWALHATYSRYLGSAPTILAGGPGNPAPDTLGAGSGWSASIHLIGNTWTVQITGDSNTIDWTIDTDSKELG